MYLMIDNYDSFVYNLKAYFEELGRDIVVRRSACALAIRCWVTARAQRWRRALAPCTAR